MTTRPAIPRFSPARTLTLALNTLTELTRLKIFYFLLIFALLVIGNSVFMAQLSFEEEFQMLKDVALGAMSIFTALIAILATALLIPKDLEDRTIYTILAKPVPRFEYLAGKLLGIGLLLAIAIGVMTALFLTALWFRESAVIAETTRQAADLPPEDLARAIDQIRASTFNANLIPGITMIFGKAMVLAAFTLFVSTFASSSIFAMFISIAVYFIGHLQSTARDYWLDGQVAQWWTKILLAIVALVFPDLQAFSFNDQIVGGLAIPTALFLQSLGLAAFYVLVYYALAVFLFTNREL